MTVGMIFKFTSTVEYIANILVMPKSKIEITSTKSNDKILSLILSDD